MAIAAGASTSTDFPFRAERYPSGSLCLVFDPAKASLTDAVNEAATPQWNPPARPHPSSVAPPPRPRRPSPAAALRLPPLLQQCVVRRLLIVVMLLGTRHIACAYSNCTTVVLQCTEGLWQRARRETLAFLRKSRDSPLRRSSGEWAATLVSWFLV